MVATSYTSSARRIALGAALGLTLAAAALAGCGSAEKRLDAADAGSLRAQLVAARTAAAGGNRAGAVAELEGFKRRSERLAATGKLASDDSRTLLAGVEQALAAARRELPAPVAPSAVTTSPTSPAPPRPAHDKHPPDRGPNDKHPQDKGAGKGHPKGDGKPREGGD